MAKNKYTYGDGSITYSTPVCIQGAKGEPGVNGEKVTKVFKAIRDNR